MNLGNLGQKLIAMGGLTMQTGLSVGMMKELSHPSCHQSIFGGMGMNPYGGMGMNPYGGMGMNPYGNMGMSPYGMSDPTSNPYSIGSGVDFASTYQQILKNMNGNKNPKAEAISKDYDTGKGVDFDSKMNTNRNEDGTEKKYKISDNKDKNSYKTDVTNYGKSYLANIDQNFGNKDGYVTEDELKKFLQKDLEADKKEEGKDEIAEFAANKFKLLDQNGDKVIDYKEMSAMFYALDADSQNKTDGIVDGNTFNNYFDEVNGVKDNGFVAKLKASWTALFSTEKKDTTES